MTLQELKQSNPEIAAWIRCMVNKRGNMTSWQQMAYFEGTILLIPHLLKMKEALEFYSNLDNHRSYVDGKIKYQPLVIQDHGFKACVVLSAYAEFVEGVK